MGLGWGNKMGNYQHKMESVNRTEMLSKLIALFNYFSPLLQKRMHHMLINVLN